MDKILKILNNKFEPCDRELFWNHKKFTTTKLFLKTVLFSCRQSRGSSRKDFSGGGGGGCLSHLKFFQRFSLLLMLETEIIETRSATADYQPLATFGWLLLVVWINN